MKVRVTVASLFLVAACTGGAQEPLADDEVGRCDPEASGGDSMPESVVFRLTSTYNKVTDLRIVSRQSGVATTRVELSGAPQVTTLPMSLELAERVRVELDSGGKHVFLGLAAKPADEPRLVMAVFVRGERALVAGNCGEWLTAVLERLAAKRNLSSAEVLRRLAENDTEMQAAVRAEAQAAAPATGMPG